MKHLIATIFWIALLASNALATEYFASSGVGSGSTTAGSDSANCTTISTPCLTVLGALGKMKTAFGISGGGGHILTLRGGDYDVGQGFKVSGDTVILSGSSDVSPFTVQAYPGNCGSTYASTGTSSCEPVRFIQALIAGSHTLDDMQSVGGPKCASNTKDCIGAPTDAECMAAYGTTVPNDCWSGGGGVPLDLTQDRSGGQLSSVGLLEFYGLPEGRQVSYVVFDGIKFDARGIAANVIRTTVNYNHTLTAKHITFLNGEWLNSAHSCMAQPGVGGTDTGTAGGSPYGDQYLGLSWEYEVAFISGTWQNTVLHQNNMLWQNFKFHHCGIPFNTKTVGGVNARDIEAAKFKHAAYMHVGGNELINIESYSNAGSGVGFEGPNNFLRQSYIHDNACIGVQFQGGYGMTVENTVFHNNGCVDVQMPGLGPHVPLDSSEKHRVQNNTMIFGSKNIYGAGVQIGALNHGGIIENNVIDGYPRPIEGQPCGSVSDGGGNSHCTYTDRFIIRNNILRSSTPGNEIVIPGTDSVSGVPASNPVVKPECSLGGSQTLSTCNQLNVDPLIVSSPTPPNYTLQAGSPAVNAAFNNGFTVDYLGNTRANGASTGAAIDIGALEYCNAGLGACNTAPTTATISVLSSGASGVSVSWGSGCTNPSVSSPQSTSFNLVCDLGSTLTFTAPGTASSLNFTVWTGCDSISTTACTITSLAGGRSINAGYGATKALVISSTVQSSVSITVSPNDTGGLNNGTTNFSRSYNTGAVVTITAPTTSGGSYFNVWTGCDSTSGALGQICSVTMGVSDRSISAAYGGNGCGLAKTLTIGQTVEICAGNTINIYDNYTEDGAFVGTQTAGHQGVVIGGPGDFEGTDYYDVNFATGVDGWLTSVNVFVPGGSPPPSGTTVGIGSGKSVRVGSGITFKVY